MNKTEPYWKSNREAAFEHYQERARLKGQIDGLKEAAKIVNSGKCRIYASKSVRAGLKLLIIKRILKLESNSNA